MIDFSKFRNLKDVYDYIDKNNITEWEALDLRLEYQEYKKEETKNERNE